MKDHYTLNAEGFYREYRINHIIPSVATGFFSFVSLAANSCNVSD
jgi:hypothetical protein